MSNPKTTIATPVPIDHQTIRAVDNLDFMRSGISGSFVAFDFRLVWLGGFGAYIAVGLSNIHGTISA